MFRAITSRDDKAHEEFIEKVKKEGANLIIQIDNDTNTVTKVEIFGREINVK